MLFRPMGQPVHISFVKVQPSPDLLPLAAFRTCGLLLAPLALPSSVSPCHIDTGCARMISGLGFVACASVTRRRYSRVGVAGLGCQGSVDGRRLSPCLIVEYHSMGYPISQALFEDFSKFFSWANPKIIFVLRRFFHDLSGFCLGCYPYIPPFLDGA